MEQEHKRAILSGEAANLSGVEIGIPDPKDIAFIEIKRRNISLERRSKRQDIVEKLVARLLGRSTRYEEIYCIIMSSYGVINALDADMEIGEQYDLDVLDATPKTGRFFEKNEKGYLVLKQQKPDSHNS